MWWVFCMCNWKRKRNTKTVSVLLQEDSAPFFCERVGRLLLLSGDEILSIAELTSLVP